MKNSSMVIENKNNRNKHTKYTIKQKKKETEILPFEACEVPPEASQKTNKASRALHPTFAPQLTAALILLSVS